MATGGGVMKFSLIIDPDKPEEIVATVHERSSLTEQIEALVLQHSRTDRLIGYADDEMKILPFAQIECITVLDGKIYAIDNKNQRYRLKQRLYELEEQLPSFFIRINKSTLANEAHLDRFAVTVTGSVDAVFKCGYREYISRRCFAQIKRRFEAK
jgi:DNA-binding LytR/AlgR family response regulator